MIETALYVAKVDKGRKKAEETCRNIEDKYRNLFQHSPESIVIVGLDGTVLDYNHETSPTGVRREELIGRHLSELGLYEQSSDKNEAMLARIAAGNTEPFEVDLKTRFGDRIWIEVHPATVDNPTERRIRLILSDITARKRSEIKLKKERDFSNSLIQASPAFFVAINKEGETILMHNSGAHRICYRP